MESIRAFVAVELPDEARAILYEDTKNFLSQINGVIKRVDMNQLHITLFFFEHIQKDKLAEIKEQLDRLDMKSFKITLKGFNTFDDKNLRIIFADIENAEYINKIYNYLLPTALKLDADIKKFYKPHITLARIKYIDYNNKNKLLSMIKEKQMFEFGSFNCNAIKIIESILKNDKPEYIDLYKKNLI
ncbi:MAG: RNA 2',3'-cyclic phosphodiesterase [Candidatus Micrarchaeia archaeon]